MIILALLQQQQHALYVKAWFIFLLTGYKYNSIYWNYCHDRDKLGFGWLNLTKTPSKP